MNDQLLNLGKILKLLVQLHSRLLEEAELKRKAIIDGDIKAMEEILEREQKLIGDVEKADACRDKLMLGLKSALGVTTEPLTIRSLLEKLGESNMAKALDGVRTELKEVLDKLRYRSRQNEELLKASLEHVNGFLKMINESTVTNKTYDTKGRSGGGNLRLLDRTA